jgi:predicted O-methyltransferase YrrM
MIANECSVTPLVTEIEALVDGVHGWSPIDQLFTLSTLAYTTAHLPGDIVEVGSWFGRSAVVLGSAVRDTHGIVHCIDPFPERTDWKQNVDGSYSFVREIDGQHMVGFREHTVWTDPFEKQIKPAYEAHGSVLDGFLANVRSRGLDSLVRPHRGTARSFAAQLPSDFKCRLLFLDGDHSFEAVMEDLRWLSPFVVPGGWICFDDAFSAYDGVDRAIARQILANPEYDIKRQMTRKCFIARKALA